MQENLCACGCGATVLRRYVSGHNRRGVTTPVAHRRRIGEAQAKAWQSTRTRKPVGSSWVDSSGYRRVKVVVGKGPWRLEHVIVMEREMGRPVRRGEVIHHINGDRLDNRPENLFLCRDHTHHNEVHRSQDRALRALLAVGAVVFRNGAYEAVL